VRSPVILEVDSVRKAFDVRGVRVSVLDSVSLFASDGDWVTVIGPSGCGKTTLLRIVAGLLEPDAGTASVNGAREERLGAAALLPQSALAEATGLFERFGLSGFESTYPWQLSGGMQQRVVLMRTFLSGRAILLLDEPLGALDPLTRATMQDWLLSVWNELRKTIVLVTHDVEEAVVLSDRLVVLTPRPARVLSEWSFEDLPRPRSRTDLAFMRRRAEILSVLVGGTS
jgi:ABC-type nitrate/sulfonate/bicarbonate transport system ATPase subunit